MSSQSGGPRTTVSLDTNILHYMGLVLDYAEEQNLSWDTSTQDLPGRIGSLLSRVEARANGATTQSLRQGGQTLKWLIDQDVEVQYSMLSELELLTGRVRGKAVVHAANEGLPARMWSRFREGEVRERIGLGEMATLRRDVGELVERLDNSGVRIGQMSEPHLAEVHEMANGICGLVYMEPLDGLIYATCLVTQSTYLFTADRYLRETANGIFTGNDSRYTQIRNGLLNLMQNVIGNSVGNLTLPSAHRITVNGHIKPDPQQLRGGVGV